MGISLKPSDASKGGGLIDDIDVTMSTVRFETWDYNGTIPTPILALAVSFTDDDGNTVKQHYSAGDIKNFTPSPDGTEAVQVGTQPSLNENCNTMAFLASLINAGFPEDKVADKVSVFEGTRVHVKRAPQPKRAGLKGAADGKDNTILLVSQIHTLPWDKKKVAKTATVTAKTTPTAAPAPAGNGEDLTAKGVEVMLGILSEKGGQIAKAQIAQEAFKRLAADPQRTQLVQLVYKDEFLKAGPWTFDGTTVSM